MHSTDRMNPRDVAKLIKSKHREMRTRFDELSALTKTLVTAEPREFARFLRLAQTLYIELKSQIALEAKVLVPALRVADAWGKVRADQLIAQLRARRKELRNLRKSSARKERASIGPEVDEFIDGRRASMARAERDTLDAGVLRDDVLGVDVNGG